MTQHIVYTIQYKPCVVKELKIVFRRGVAPETPPSTGYNERYIAVRP